MKALQKRSWLGSSERALTVMTASVSVVICLAGFLLTSTLADRCSDADKAAAAEDFSVDSSYAGGSIAAVVAGEVEGFARSVVHVEATHPASDEQFVHYFEGLSTLNSGVASPHLFVELLDEASPTAESANGVQANPDVPSDSLELSDGRSLVVARQAGQLADRDSRVVELLVALSNMVEEMTAPVSFIELDSVASDTPGADSERQEWLVAPTTGRDGRIFGYLLKRTSLEGALEALEGDSLGPINVQLENESLGHNVSVYGNGPTVKFEDAVYSTSENFDVAGTSWKVLSWRAGLSPRPLLLTSDIYWGLFGTLSLVLAWLMWSSRDRRTEKADQRVLLAQEMAYTDRLTGVLNRGGLFEECRNSGNVPATLFFIDLNHFKAVNDTYGHEMGDRVLLSVAETLKETTRPIDKVARIGGDEFVIVMPGMTDRRRSVRLARSIERSIAGMKSGVTASVGVACSDSQEWLDLALLIQRADSEMYERKQVYHTKMAEHPIDLVNELMDQSLPELNQIRPL